MLRLSQIVASLQIVQTWRFFEEIRQHREGLGGGWGGPGGTFGVPSFPPTAPHLVQVSYLVGEIAELFDEEGFLPQRHEGKIGLGFVRLRSRTEAGREGGRGGVEGRQT